VRPATAQRSIIVASKSNALGPRLRAPTTLDAAPWALEAKKRAASSRPRRMPRNRPETARLIGAQPRFPPPWSVEETAPCFIVRDANKQALAFVYCEDEPGRRTTAKLLTRDQARRIAANIAKLPGLLRRSPKSEACRGCSRTLHDSPRNVRLAQFQKYRGNAASDVMGTIADPCSAARTVAGSITGSVSHVSFSVTRVQRVKVGHSDLVQFGH
jgi:hypothetical protein